MGTVPSVAQKVVAKQGQAVQCDLCGVWVHAECDGISADQYKLLVSSVENIAYLCKLNRLLPITVQANDFRICESSIVNVQNELTSRLEKVEAKLNETVKEVSAKIDDLCSSNNNLKQQITTTSETINSASVQSHSVPRPASSAQDIADELADRERRKCNLIVYNLPETSDDKKRFTDICSSF